LSGHAFALVFAALMTTAAGGNALVTVMPAIGREFGISDTLIASVFALSALFWTITSPFWAVQSDRRGRKAMMILGLGGFTLSMLLFGAAVLAGMAQLAAPLAILAGMALARAIYGLIGAAANPASQAYIADRTSRADRTHSLALLASAFGLGTIVGPAIAPFFILPGVGLAGPMFAFALIGGAVTFAIWRYLPAGDFRPSAEGARPTRASKPARAVWRDPRVMPFMVYGLIMGSCQALNTQVIGFHVIDALHYTPTQAGPFIAITMFAGAAAALIAQWGLIRMLDLGPKELIRYGTGVAVFGNIMMMFAPNYFSLVMGFAVVSLGYGFTRPGFTAGASLAVKASEQGVVAGAVAAVNGACWLVAPILGVALYQWRDFAPYAVTAVTLGALVWYAFFDRVLKSAGITAADSEAPAQPTPV